ncbi:MAG: restriction endonuclease subunit S [Bacilli bacterium]|nr:restriction endonuclease subunit S [Bacilli bacterium]
MILSDYYIILYIKNIVFIVNTIGTVDDLIEKYEEIINSIKRTRSHLFSKYKGLAISEDEILNHISLENGAQPPKEQHIYEEKEGYVRFVQNRDYDSDSHLTYIPVSKKNHLCNVFDIMMDKYGDAGAVRYGIAGAFNVALLKIISKKNYEKEYIRDFLSQNDIKSILFSSSQASTRPSLNETTFKGVLIPLPDRASLEEYEDKTSLLLRIEFETKKKVAKLKEIKQQLLQKYF